MRRTALFICDLQTKTVDKLYYKIDILKNVNKLLYMKPYIPQFEKCVVSLFIPEKLGVLDKRVHHTEHIDKIVSKTTYSMMTKDVAEYVHSNKITDIILSGMEIQWCIKRTVDDLRECNVNVHIPVDAIGNALSHKENKFNVKHLQHKNVQFGTTDSIICSYLNYHDDEASKKYLHYIKKQEAQNPRFTSSSNRSVHYPTNTGRIEVVSPGTSNSGPSAY